MSEDFFVLDTSGMQSLDEKKIEALRRDYPDLPETYFVFLARYGCGDTGSLIFYSGPIAFSDVFTAAAPQPHLLPFCDDGQGWVYCFDVADYDDADLGRVVSVDPRGQIEDIPPDYFLEFLFSYFGDEDVYAEEDDSPEYTDS